MSDQAFFTATLGSDSFAKLRDNAEAGLAKARLRTAILYSSGPQTLTTALDFVICDTTSGAFTVNLPAAPTAGDRVEFFISGGNNDLTIGRNGKTINGASSDLVLHVNLRRLVLQYYSTGNDWKVETARRRIVKRYTSGPQTIAGEAEVFEGNGTFTLNLPASPTDGEEYEIVQTAGASTLTVGRNGKTINGAAADSTLASAYAGKRYTWLNTQNTWWER